MNTTIPKAEASYGLKDALGTIGIAAGIGTTLGLSTLAFYESPTAHFQNVLMGAGAGVIVGLGVAAYLMASSPETDEISPEELLPPENKPVDKLKKPEMDSTKLKNSKQSILMPPRRIFRLAHDRRNTSVQLTLPQQGAFRAVGHEWILAMQVIELRF